MKPMILPWLARTWRVSEARAETLWRRACRYAECATGETETSRYWEVAKAQMIDLLDDELRACYPAAEAPSIMMQLQATRSTGFVDYWFPETTSCFSHSAHA
jgi:hypothetical protein